MTNLPAETWHDAWVLLHREHDKLQTRHADQAVEIAALNTELLELYRRLDC